MSDLLSSLRSLLPQEYLREQSSTCDDLEEATNYIKNLETSIKELEDKRDKLKKSSSLSLSSSSSSSSSKKSDNKNGNDIIISTNNSNNRGNNNNNNNNNNYNVSIHTFARRIEIEISVKVEGKEGFPTSKLLKQVSPIEGLEVVACFSSIVDKYWKCIIHCDLVNDHQASIDFSELQRNLITEISSYVV